MTLRDLEIFIEVVETKSMSEAAKNLNISQPTVSHAIAQIEREYNVKLFNRVSKKLFITDVGLKLFDYANNITRDFCHIVSFLTNISDEKILNIGVSSSLNTDLILKIVSKYEEEFKYPNFRIFQINQRELKERLLEGTIDIAINDGALLDRDIFNEKICSVDYVVCNFNNEFTEPVDLGDLVDRDIAIIETEYMSPLHTEIKSYLNVKWTVESMDSLINLIHKSNAVGIVPKLCVDEGVNVCSLKNGHKTELFLAYHRGKLLNKYESEFVNSIFDYYSVNTSSTL